MRKILWLFVVVGLIAALSHAAQAGTMLVASQGTNKIVKYDSTTGAYLGVFADVTAQGGAPQIMRISPDNSMLYVILGQSNISRYRMSDGAYLDTVVTDNPLRGLAFQPGDNQNLYIGRYQAPSTNAYAVTKLDLTTGDRTGYAMYNPAAAPWDTSCIGIAFGLDPSGNEIFYAYNDWSGANRIIKYAADGSGDRGYTGLGNLVTGLGNMNSSDLIWSPARNAVYVPHSFGSWIAQITPSGAKTNYQPAGGFGGTVSSLAQGPDGNIYMPASAGKVWKFDGSAMSVFLDDPVNIQNAYGIVFLAPEAKLTAIPDGDSTLDFDLGHWDGGTGNLYSAVSLQNTGEAGSVIDLQGAFFGPGSDPFFSIVPGHGDPNRDLAAGGPPELFDLQFNATGLPLPPGLYLADLTFQNDRPQGDVTYHLRATVRAIAEPAGLGLIGMALLAIRKRRA